MQEVELRSGLAMVQLHQKRLQAIYSSLGEDRPTKKVKLLMSGQEEVKEQLQCLRHCMIDMFGREEQVDTCSHCRVPLFSDQSR